MYKQDSATPHRRRPPPSPEDGNRFMISRSCSRSRMPIIKQQPRIIYIRDPAEVQADPSDFMRVVQSLTGASINVSSGDYSRSSASSSSAPASISISSGAAERAAEYNQKKKMMMMMNGPPPDVEDMPKAGSNSEASPSISMMMMMKDVVLEDDRMNDINEAGGDFKRRRRESAAASTTTISSTIEVGRRHGDLFREFEDEYDRTTDHDSLLAMMNMKKKLIDPTAAASDHSSTTTTTTSNLSTLSASASRIIGSSCNNNNIHGMIHMVDDDQYYNSNNNLIISADHHHHHHRSPSSSSLCCSPADCSDQLPAVDHDHLLIIPVDEPKSFPFSRSSSSSASSISFHPSAHHHKTSNPSFSQMQDVRFLCAHHHQFHSAADTIEASDSGAADITHFCCCCCCCCCCTCCKFGYRSSPVVLQEDRFASVVAAKYDSMSTFCGERLEDLVVHVELSNIDVVDMEHLQNYFEND